MKREDLLSPEKYNLISEVERFADESGKKAILWKSEQGEEKDITYDDLMKNANKIGNAFMSQGLEKGDVILVMIPRLIEAYETYVAALKSGMVVIPSSEMLRSKDLKYRIVHGDVKAIVSYAPYTEQFDEVEESSGLKKFVIGEEKEGWHSLDQLMKEASDQLELADTSRDDMAFLSYTSGTTGNPKGVVHTHGWAYAHLKTAAKKWLSIEEGDTVWATAGPGWQKWIWSPFPFCFGFRGNRPCLSRKIRAGHLSANA